MTNVYRYNGTNWSVVAGLPTARSRLAVGLFNNAIHAFGGADISGNAQTNVYRYSVSNWTEVVGLPSPRAELAAGTLGGALYAVGGSDQDGIASSNVYRYMGSAWTNMPGLPVAKTGLGADVLSGSLYAIGAGSNNAYRFNGTTWTSVTGPYGSRSNLAVAVFRNMLYAIGGMDVNGVAQTNVYLNITGSIWLEAPRLPEPRTALAAGVLNNVLYAVGGSDGTTAQSNVYRYPRIAIDPGVSPSNGRSSGGCSVTITGSNLCNGADITNVTICGISAASIVSQSKTQIVVTTAPGTPGLGDVAVFSIGYGTTVKPNAFCYNPTITISTGPHGTGTQTGVVEVAYGGTTSIVVVADAYYHIQNLVNNGTSVGEASNQTTYTSTWVNVTGSGVLGAAFEANMTTTNPTPHWWLAHHGWTNNFDSAALGDPDGDGHPNWAEYLAGTDPTNAASCLKIVGITNVMSVEAAGFDVSWSSVSGKFYRIERGTNLLDLPPFPFTVWSNVLATPPINSQRDTNAPGAGSYFYQIRLE